MKQKIGFFVRLLNFIAPKACHICGNRLSIIEDGICEKCKLHLPRTCLYENPYENHLAKMFWGLFPIEKAAALIHYEPHAPASRMVYAMKYSYNPELCRQTGILIAEELKDSTFFDGIDAIIPVPLSKKRKKERGYNQSCEIAKGISEVTGIPVCDDIIKRETFKGSQTEKHRWERIENVENVFKLRKAERITDKHILIIDDIITTGATITSCARELRKCQNIKISILAFGLTKK